MKGSRWILVRNREDLSPKESEALAAAWDAFDMGEEFDADDAADDTDEQPQDPEEDE